MNSTSLRQMLCTFHNVHSASFASPGWNSPLFVCYFVCSLLAYLVWTHCIYLKNNTIITRFLMYIILFWCWNPPFVFDFSLCLQLKIKKIYFSICRCSEMWATGLRCLRVLQVLHMHGLDEGWQRERKRVNLSPGTGLYGRIVSQELINPRK